MAKLQDAMRDLIAGGGRFSAPPVLSWKRELNAEKAVERMERRQPVDIHLGESQFRLHGSEQLADLHVLASSGRYELLRDPKLGEVLVSGKLTGLESDQGTHPYALYNLLSGRWPGEVKHYSQPTDRQDVLAKAFVHHGLLQPADFPQPARAESLRTILENHYANANDAERALKQNVSIRFGSRISPRDLPEYVTRQSIELDAKQLNDPERVQRAVQALQAARACESESFGLKPEEARVDSALARAVWKEDFELEQTLDTIRLCGGRADGRVHLYRLLERPLDERRTQVYFQAVDALKSGPVPDHVQVWLMERPDRTDQRLELLKQARPFYPPGSEAGPIFRTALALAEHQDTAAARSFADKVAKLEKPGADFGRYLRTPVQHRERFLELFAESGTRLPLGKCFQQIDALGPEWKLRYEPLRASGMSATWATWAGVHLPNHDKENLQLAQALVPNNPADLDGYREALEFAVSLSPNSKAAFARIYGSGRLEGWEIGRDCLFVDGKDPQPAAVEVASLLATRPGACSWSLQELVKRKAPMEVVKANLLASQPEQHARYNRWDKYFTMKLSQAHNEDDSQQVARFQKNLKLLKAGKGPWGEPPV